MSNHRNVIEVFFINILKAMIIFYGIFTVFSWIMLVANISFNTFAYVLFPVAILSSGIFYYLIQNKNITPVENTQRNKIYQQPHNTQLFNLYLILGASLLFLTSFVITFVGIEPHFTVAWLLLTAGFIPLYFYIKQRSSHKPCPPIKAKNEVVPALILGVSLIVLYFYCVWWDSDDTHFLSYTARSLHNPNEIFGMYDGIFNKGGLSFIFPLNFGQSWELLTASIEYTTGFSVFTSYYLALPALILFLTPFLYIQVIKHYSKRFSFFAAIFCILFLIAWSINNHLHGMFFIPRIYQGKGVLLTFCMPLVIWCWHNYINTNNLTNKILLSLSLICCAGSSTTGAYISIILLGVLYLAHCIETNKINIKQMAVIALICLPNLAALMVIKSNIDNFKSYRYQQTQAATMNEQQAIDYKPHKKIEKKRDTSSMYWLFGGNKNLSIILLMIGISAILCAVNMNIKESIKSVSVLFMISFLTLNHWLAMFIAENIGPPNIVWRLHWAMPLVIILGLFTISLLQSTQIILSKINTSLKLQLNAKVIVFLSFIPLLVVSLYIIERGSPYIKQIYTNKFRPFKYNHTAFNVADIVAKEVTDDKLILADSRVAQLLPMLPRSSKLLTSRVLYQHVYPLTKKEVKQHNTLQHYIDNINTLKHDELMTLLMLSKAAGVTALVFESSISTNKTLENYSSYSCRPMAEQWYFCQ
ncbi:DUF6077 domain-containing protein [Thalassotalea agariperforans]